MKAAFILTGGIGDVLLGLAGPELWSWANREYNATAQADIYINSHIEIIDFVNTCTYFRAFPCPSRLKTFKDEENPLNLGAEFLDKLFKDYNEVFSCFPDGLGQAPFAFRWFEYVKNYKDFLRTKVHIRTKNNFSHPSINKDTKNIFINCTSVTMEKNYSLVELQKLVDLFSKTNYNIIIARTSQWKGIPIPFFLRGKFIDLVDQPINDIINILNQCDYFAGIDSGLAHVAYHLGLPRLVLQHNNHPMHIARYHEDVGDDLPLNSSAEQVFNRIMLNLRDPITQTAPTNFNIPYQTNTKQLLYKKYYD